jgi:RNA polymerase sigma-70 factor (ECF subfamily)
MATESDHDLIEQARTGNRDAFGVFVRRHQRRIFRLAVHMLRDTAEAEDVVQETFVRAWQALARFEGNSQPYTWLYRIAVNLSLNIIRTRKPRVQPADDDDPRIEAWLASKASTATDPATTAEHKQVALALAEGIDQLSETLRTTLILVCVEGLPHESVSAILGCPEGTVAWRVHEARRKLREHMDGRGFGESTEGRR